MIGVHGVTLALINNDSVAETEMLFAQSLENHFDVPRLHDHAPPVADIVTEISYCLTNHLQRHVDADSSVWSLQIMRDGLTQIFKLQLVDQLFVVVDPELHLGKDEFFPRLLSFEPVHAASQNNLGKLFGQGKFLSDLSSDGQLFASREICRHGPFDIV